MASRVDDGVDPITELLEKFSITTDTLDPGSSCWVEVTHINTPHSFYVLPTAFRDCMDQVEGEGNKLNATDIQPGMFVNFWSKRLKKFVRGKVTFIDSEAQKYDLLSIDYGFPVKDVPMKYIRKTKVTIPPLSLHCKLADCMPLKGDKFSEEAISAMRFYVDNSHDFKIIKMYIREKQPQYLVVDLKNAERIADLLFLTGYTSFGYASNSISKLSMAPATKEPDLHFKWDQFKVNDTIRVRVQSGKSANDFFVADNSNYQKYLHEKKNFTHYCKNFAKCLTLNDIELYKAVAVRTSYGEYERAIIQEILGKKMRVQLVDWGTTQDVDFEFLKVIEKDFLEYPVAAIYCRAAEESEPVNLLLGAQLLLKIKEVGTGFHKPNIVLVLKSY